VSSLIKLYNRFSGLWFFTFPHINFMDSYICLNTSDGVVPTNQPLLHQYSFIHGFQISGSVQRFVPLFLVGSNTDSVLRRFPVLNVRFFVTFRFFCDYQGLTLLCAFLSFTSSSVLSIIFLYLYIGGLLNALAAVEVAAGWERVYTCGIWC
jgi:hypothetical protein